MGGRHCDHCDCLITERLNRISGLVLCEWCMDDELKDMEMNRTTDHAAIAKTIREHFTPRT